jgi:hypothetical protein
MIIPEWALGVAVVDATWLPAGSVVEGAWTQGVSWSPSILATCSKYRGRPDISVQT